MKDLSIRKLPGVGRVNERLLESFGVKVSYTYIDYSARLISSHQDLRRHLQSPGGNLVDG